MELWVGGWALDGVIITTMDGEEVGAHSIHMVAILVGVAVVVDVVGVVDVVVVVDVAVDVAVVVLEVVVRNLHHIDFFFLFRMWW